MESFFAKRDSILSADDSNRTIFRRRMKTFFKYKKEKFWGYVVCFVTFLVTVTIGILALISKECMYLVIFGNYELYREHVLVLVMILDFWIFSFNAALFYGLKFKNPVLIFLWISTMMISWNIYVFTRLINLVDKAVQAKTEVKDLYDDICHLFPIVGIWLLMISIIWDYWQTISNITDIPELVESVLQWQAHGHAGTTMAAEGSSLAGGSEYTTSSKVARLSPKNY